MTAKPSLDGPPTEFMTTLVELLVADNRAAELEIIKRLDRYQLAELFHTGIWLAHLCGTETVLRYAPAGKETPE